MYGCEKAHLQYRCKFRLIRRPVFFFKQKTGYEMRISDWSSDVCSSDLGRPRQGPDLFPAQPDAGATGAGRHAAGGILQRSEEHTSELQSLMRISYAVFCLKKKQYT